MTAPIYDFEIKAWNYRALEFQRLTMLRGTQEEAERGARALRDKHRISIRLQRGCLRWTFRAENPAKVLPAGLDRGTLRSFEFEVWEPATRKFRRVEWTPPITQEEAMDKARALLAAGHAKVRVRHGIVKRTLDREAVEHPRF